MFLPLCTTLTRTHTMRRVLLILATFFAVLVTLVPTASAAPKFKVLHAFGNGQDGAGTWGSLTLDEQGNVYGATSGGGGTGCNGQGCGTVFELTPAGNGNWNERILYSFKDKPDGSGPFASVIFDRNGNLYGTTYYGGAFGYGTVFELTPSSSGWEENVLFSFDLTDGARPYGGVVMDKPGNLYGAAGIVFELIPGSAGWTESVIYDFPKLRDGYGPYATPILDKRGNLFGTTEFGGMQCGTSSCGVVYELSPEAGGKWKERVLHRFHGRDGQFPGAGALIMDASGDLYGTTVNGGPYLGVVFKLTPEDNDRWNETVIYSFRSGTSGSGPGGGVVQDKAGNLYGTTIYGGSPNCDCGVVYKLAPKKNGKWKYTVLHTFIGSDGAQPDANLILDDKGNLYGTAATGGAYNAGVAFEITP